MRRTLIILFITFQYCLFAAETIDYQFVEKQSKSFFEKNDVKNLNKIGKLAIKNHIDYFYLRMRLGIANFSKHNYVKALPHFEHAVAFNSGDTLALEYLYYCYVYTGNENEAIKIARKMPKAKQKQLKCAKPKIVESISFQGAYQLNKSYDKQITENKNIPKIPLKRDLNKNFQFYNLGLNHHPFRRFTFNHSVSVFTAANTLYPYIPVDSSFEGYTKQQQYYAFGKYSITKNFDIGFGFHTIKTASDWAGYNATKLKYEIQSSTSQSHVYFYNLGWRYRYCQFSFFNGFSNLNSKKQTQYSFSVYFFPRGNTNVYIGKEITLQMTDSTSYFVKQSLGLKIPKIPCWLEVFYSSGNMRNFTEANGSVVFNAKESSLMKTGVGIIVPLFKNNCILTFNWIYEKKEPTLPYDFSLPSLSNSNVNLTNTNHQTFVGGITLKL